MNSPWARSWMQEQGASEEIKVFKDQVKTLLTLAGIAALGLTLAHSCVEATVKTTEIQRQYYSKPDTEHEGYSVFFGKHGSPAPHEMAKAVMSVKPANRPVLAAVAVVETGGNPGIRNGGYKGQHAGAFQVNPKYYGKVPTDAAGQALQAERILEDLVAKSHRGSLRHALARYNGGDRPPGISYRYAGRVIAFAKQVKP